MCMSMSESVIEFLRFFLPTFLPHLLICKSWGVVVVVVGSGSGTESGS